jgi:8-amino-7-oxononanoate synthase
LDIFQKCLDYRTARDVRAAGLYPYYRTIASAQDPEVVMADGQRLVMLGSNNYLGLTNHPEVKAAAAAALARYGTGCAGSRLLNGSLDLHEALEARLAAFMHREAALTFSTGFQVNLGTLSCLLGRHDYAILDSLDHACILDGARLGFGKIYKFKHNDLESLEQKLAAVPDGWGRLIVVDGVFSMEGDVAPLPGIAELKKRFGARLMVDDAHGIGVIGDGGRGSVAAAGLGQGDVPILMGTLGKALGTAGAFVAGPTDLVEALIQFARPYVYTTAMPPALAEATRTSLRISQAEGWRRDRLQGLIARFRLGVARLGLPLLASDTPIQPILLGTSASVARWSDALWRQGVLVGAIRPPTVPADAARLRITLSAAHTPAQVDTLLAVLEETRDSLGDA